MEPAGTTASRRGLHLLALGLGLAGAVLAYRWLDLPRRASVDGMRELLDASAPYGPLVFMAMVVAGIFTQVPFMGSLLVAIGAVLFRPWPAFAYGWMASLVGTTGTFLLARFVARDYVRRVLAERFARLQALDDRLTGRGLLTVFGLRVLGGLAPPLNWGLGLTGVSLRDYLVGTALGLVPGIGLLVVFADSIVSRSPGGGGLSTVVLLRGASLVAFGGSMVQGASRRGGAQPNAEQQGSRTPLRANLVSFALFYATLFAAPGTTEGAASLVLAIAGSALAVVGAVVVRRARDHLGAAWSFAPRADADVGVVTTGLYRRVRHPVYLGLGLLTVGEAVAFRNGAALLVVGAVVLPTLLWRAAIEERLLIRVFGERYAAYRAHTKMLIPYLL